MEYSGTRIKIVQFNEHYRPALEAFELEERQMIYSSLPKEVLDEGLMDPNRRPCVVLNHDDEVVGFFVLHQYYQHEGYDTPVNAVYVRSLSINNKLQGNGYGTEIMMNIPEFVQGVFPDFDRLFLVVDAENEAAWNLYERAGFLHLATNPEGPIGKERLYYLDLDANYVSKLKLKEEDGKVILEIDGNAIGQLALVMENDTAVMEDIQIHEDEMKIKENLIRQIATFVRKHHPDIKRISVDVVPENQALYLSNNFVMMNPDMPERLTKLIQY